MIPLTTRFVYIFVTHYFLVLTFFCENIVSYLLDISFILPASIWSSAVLALFCLLFVSEDLLFFGNFTIVKSGVQTFNRFIKGEKGFGFNSIFLLNFGRKKRSRKSLDAITSSRTGFVLSWMRFEVQSRCNAFSLALHNEIKRTSMISGKNIWCH